VTLSVRVTLRVRGWYRVRVPLRVSVRFMVRVSFIFWYMCIRISSWYMCISISSCLVLHCVVMSWVLTSCLVLTQPRSCVWCNLCRYIYPINVRTEEVHHTLHGCITKSVGADCIYFCLSIIHILHIGLYTKYCQKQRFLSATTHLYIGTGRPSGKVRVTISLKVR
jgi:hypothetical protein